MDQLRNCKETAARKGWVFLDQYVFTDEEKSGTTLHGRTGLADLMAAADTSPKPFDYIISDDSSRLGRNKADVFKTLDILRFLQVNIYFVEDGLDSAASWFDNAFNGNAQRDQEYSKSLGHKTSRGKRGRFLAGYHPGGGCYGYRNVPDEDKTRIVEYGRFDVKGVHQEVVAEEKEVLVHIFEMFARGMSLRDIARTLNQHGVPTSQNSRSGRKPEWCKSAIKEMLKNKRYLGKTEYGRSRQVRHPITGKMIVRKVDEGEWDRMDHPELKIIDDDLWGKVEDRFAHVTKRIGVKKQGGMSRTEASRKYLFRSLLKCGLCRENVNIATTNPTRYGCSNHREGGACPNKTTILLDVLEREFLSALLGNLKCAALRERMVDALVKHLKTKTTKLASSHHTVDQGRAEMEETRKILSGEIKTLVRAIKEGRPSRALTEEIAELEARIDRIDEVLATEAEPPAPEISEKDVRQFVNDSIEWFYELLAGAPQAVKYKFQKMKPTIVLTPSVDERGPIYTVTGDLDLFSVSKDAMQSNRLASIALHYNIPVHFVVAVRTRQARKPETTGASVELAMFEREHSALDIDAILAAALSDHQTHGYSDIWKDAVGDTEVVGYYEYRDGFGGLRLATAMVAALPSSALCF